MPVFVDEIHDCLAREQDIYERRDQRQQYLEDDDVRQRDPAQHAFSGKGLAMFKDRLQNSEGPAEALAHQSAGIDRRLGVGERTIFVLHTISAAEQCHGEVCVFGNRVGVERSRLTHD